MRFSAEDGVHSLIVGLGWSIQFRSGLERKRNILILELELKKLSVTAEVPLLCFHANTAKGNEEYKLNLLFIGS